MKKIILGFILLLSLGLCPALYFIVGPKLNQMQIEALITCLIVCGISALYCFIVGELTNNNSQMDKLWSLLPEVYVWIMAAKSSFDLRLLVMAILVSLWGIRLTVNFGRKGAYRLKFWSGEEDYRWKVLKAKKEFQPHFKWALFNLFFISIYQNVLVLATTLPALVSIGSNKPFGIVDIIASVLVLFFLAIEMIADETQWRFQSKKWAMINNGQKLEDLPEPYNLGFNTLGLWNYSRHPNYFGEQAIWVSFYLFSIAAGIGIINWSMIGALLLIVLFMGSSNFAEEISKTKYPMYSDYCKKVSRFIPFKRYIKRDKIKENA